jgi:hypothetical protein
MQFDAFIFKLLLLSIPGFITYIIFRKIAVYRRSTKNQFGYAEIFIVIICSLVSCTVYDLAVMVINTILKTNYSTTIMKLFNIDKSEIYNAKEMLFLCLIAIGLGFLFSFFETRKIINKIAMLLKVSKYYGDDDIWTLFCANKNTQWLYIRDHKLNLIYFGNLEYYSDPGEDRELLLTDVQVFSEDGEYCYNSPRIYICRQSDDITLEIPLNNKENKDE